MTCMLMDTDFDDHMLGCLKNIHNSTDDDIRMMMEDRNDGAVIRDVNHWQAFEFSNIT